MLDELQRVVRRPRRFWSSVLDRFGEQAEIHAEQRQRLAGAIVQFARDVAALFILSAQKFPGGFPIAHAPFNLANGLLGFFAVSDVQDHAEHARFIANSAAFAINPSQAELRMVEAVLEFHLA